MPTDDSRTKIGPQTWISGGILGAALVGTATVVRLYSSITDTQETLVRQSAEQSASLRVVSDELARMRYDVNEALDDKITGTDVRFWVQDFARLNPTLDVPPFGRVKLDDQRASGGNTRK